MIEESDLERELEQIQARAVQELETVQDEAALQAWRVRHLGRSAPVMQVFSRLGQVSKEQRPLVGQRANQVKQALEAAQNERSQASSAPPWRNR